MSKPLFRIFVSSTYIDLIDYRKAAEKAINEQGQKYEGMEYIGALQEEPVTASLEMVAQCDLFIGIYAWRYGTVPDGTAYSITEQEYRHAQKLGKACLCYIVDEEFDWKPKFVDKGPAAEKIALFKDSLSKEHVRATFKAPIHLENSIIRDLSNWLARHRSGLKQEALKPGQDPLPAYRRAVAEKYAALSMIGFKRSFAMDSIYIPLTVHADRESRIEMPHEALAEKLLARSLTAEDLLELPLKAAVVLGEPGMGKTTMLHYLALQESRKAQGLLPIFVKLADFCKTRGPLEAYLLDAVENHVSGAEMRGAAKNALQAQRALVLLDGLDEVARDEYSTVCERVRAFIAGHRECRVIITSRKAGFQDHEMPYRIFEVDKLPLSEIKAFVDKWFETETDLAERIAANSRIHELAQNPFLLSIICFIFEKDQSLPRRRVELYRKCAVTLLTLYDERQVPKANGFTRLLKERVLEDLAYHFFCQEVDEFPYAPLVEQVAQTLAGMGKQHNEEQVLREIRENSGLLQQSDDRHLFVHRTFYEYYVACKLRSDTPEAVLARASEARWEEPLRLYAAQIESAEEGTGFFEQLWAKDRALALRCYPDMDRVVEAGLIQDLLDKAEVDERIELVKGLPEKIADPAKIVETLRELFRWETNGEVIYWGVEILEEMADTPGAKGIVYRKLDKGAQQRYQEYVAKDMVAIAAGKFRMGAVEDEFEWEKPLHEVKLSGFSIGRYAVTNALYEKFDPGHRKLRDQYSSEDGQPVIYVNWYEALMFCRWLGCRLPTEAQWEYACRAGTATPFYTGETLSAEQANYNGNYPYKKSPKGKYLQKTTTAGSYPPNPWGLYDMHGNVYEWCMDWFDEAYYQTCQQQGVAENPTGPENGSCRVLRGGDWYSLGKDCRSAHRTYADPGYRDDGIGFRLVFVP